MRADMHLRPLAVVSWTPLSIALKAPESGHDAALPESVLPYYETSSASIPSQSQKAGLRETLSSSDQAYGPFPPKTTCTNSSGPSTFRHRTEPEQNSTPRISKGQNYAAMLATAARRAISATTRVYPPIMPPNATGAATAAARRGLGGVRWVPTIFTLVCLGYGVSTYRRNQIEKYLARNSDLERQERNRRRRNAMLMDAYGEKSSLADIERAMALYEAQQGNE